MLLEWRGKKGRQVKSEQVKVNFTFQTILILALLEYETVSISFVTIIIVNILVEYHFFNA